MVVVAITDYSLRDETIQRTAVGPGEVLEGDRLCSLEIRIASPEGLEDILGHPSDEIRFLYDTFYRRIELTSRSAWFSMIIRIPFTTSLRPLRGTVSQNRDRLPGHSAR